MTREEAVKDETITVQKILDNHFARTITKVYGGKDGFLQSLDTWFGAARRHDNREMTRYVTLFAIPMDRIVVYPRIDGKRTCITDEVKRGISGYRFVGKVDYPKANFHHKSFIMITADHLDRILADNRILDAQSDYYTDKDRTRIYGFA